MYEVEIKYRVGERVEKLVQKLLEKKCKLAYRIDEVDIYFSHPCKDFAKTDEALRLRIERRDNSETCVLTYKGPRIKSEGKTREEISIEIDNMENCIKILEKLGFRKVIEIVKHRQVFEKENLTITLDQVEELGNFVEIECVTNSEQLVEHCIRDIKNFAKEIGLEDSMIVDKTYLELMLEKRGSY